MFLVLIYGLLKSLSLNFIFKIFFIAVLIKVMLNLFFFKVFINFFVKYLIFGSLMLSFVYSESAAVFL